MKKFNYLFVLVFLILLVGCSKKQYEVKFIGFNESVIETVQVKKGENLTYPIAPLVDGYNFVKWDQDIKNVNKNTIITAIYEAKQFNVKFYNELDEIISEKIVKYGESCIAPSSPSKEGYNFIGWDCDLSSVKSNLEVRPLFDLKTFTVKFYDADGLVVKTETVNYGESAKGVTSPTKEGYNFTGWDSDFSSVKSNLDVRPLFEIKTFTVKFYDGVGNVIKTEIVNYGESAIGVNTPNKDGHKFTGWDQDFNSVKSDLDVRPVYEKLIFTVNFYDNYGNIIKTEKVAYGESAIGIEAPEIEGLYFVSWDHELNNVTDNLDIIPIYEQYIFTVKFYDANGLVIKTETVIYGESAVGIEAPYRKGFKFLRWDENYEEVKSNLDIHPIYEELIYKVTFVDYYGNVIKTEMVELDKSATAPAAPVVDYHTFSRWDLDFSEVKSNMTVKAIYVKNFATYDISSADYWLQILSYKYDLNKTILTSTEIDSYNAQITSTYSKTKVVDVLSIIGTKTSSYVSELINKYSNINRYTVFNKDTNVALSATEKNDILSNRNLNNIPSSVEIKYGIITDFAWMRSYPTNHYSNVYEMDRFQETSLNVGEGVAIYHESSDKEWYFVQAENYNGWVEKKYIAECSYNELQTFLKPDDNLLVIADYLTLESAHVRMGQSFPLLSVNSDSYVINFPTRNSEGVLELKELAIAKSNDYHEGYLDYTYKNVFVQAFKLLGIDYSWGDKDKLGRDCSSTMNAIYKCFGFMMPRNTSNQVAIPTYGTKVSGLTNTSIQNYKPGTLIFTSSHVMLYLGENENGIAYLLHNTTSGDGACILQSLNDYGGSRINGVLKLQ